MFAPKITRTWIAGLVFLAALAFSGCEKTGISPSTDQPVSESLTPAVAHGKTIFPVRAERTFTWQSSQGGYTGGTVNIPGGATLSLPNLALTPPPGTNPGDPVTITMEVDVVRYRGKNLLQFTFGPHGSIFNPRVEITLDWTALNVNLAQLFYIDDGGNLVPQNPDQIDITNKRMTLFLDHFSRYALSSE